MVFHKPLQAEQRALALLLRHEKNYSYRKIASITKISKSSVFDVIKKAGERKKRHSTKETDESKGGRPQLLTERDKRKLQRALKTLREKDPNFTIMQVVQSSGIDINSASYRTFVRHIKKMGYGFYQSRKKGVMTTKDFKQRRKFGRDMRNKPVHYWAKDIAFYLDAVSFVYKSNPMSDALKPKTRLWRMRSEGLIFTTKGSKDLAGGKRLHLLVAIAYGKGVICAEMYEKMSGHYFARFIRRHFPILFEITGKADCDNKIFVMDNDPSQTSMKAKRALRSVNATMRTIPPRSPDFNPIENIFHVLRKRLQSEVKAKNITRQTWEEFVERVQRNIWSMSKEYIDKTIASMPNRIKAVVKGKGHRTKY